MKNKIVILTAMIAYACVVSAQVAKWLIPPMYDNIHMAIGEDVVITDSMDYKILWSLSGQRLACTENQIFPYADGRAVTTKRGSTTITGIIDKHGKLAQLTGCSVTFSKPYFSDHYLLVHEDEEGFFRFVNTEGLMLSGSYAKAYPFSNGYASCLAYENIIKRKNTYSLLITKDNEPVSFSYNGKQFDNDDIDFISSVNDENIGIVIAKDRFYYFNGKDRSLTPIFARKDEANKKNQAKLDGELSANFYYKSDSTVVLMAKCGKNDIIEIVLDELYIPQSIKLADGEHTYKKRTAEKRLYKSPLKRNTDGDKYGISWESREMLPPQFDDLITCIGDVAFVRLNGKCGMLQILKDEDFKISINKGNPIDFRHQKYETNIRVDLPTIVSAYESRVEINPSSGCDVDMTSGEKKNTEFGNFIQYNCVLNIPKSLPDEMYGDARNEITYPTQIIYSGLKSPVIPFKVKAWHYKYFNVDVNDAETSINKGELSFTFNINAERNPGEPVYPTTVNIQTDSLQCELEKMSETRYKCKVMTLKEGNNNIVVQIMEEGCPPASFPFEVAYTKPSARSKAKEDVKIKKKAKKAQEPPTPHLDI